MGISKKQYALAAKAGLTREQAGRFIAGAGNEPSPTEAYDKIGNLLKGRSVQTAFGQAKQGMGIEPGWVGLPKSSALAGIKPIEPGVSVAQPPETPKTAAPTATEMIKPVEQPKKFEKRKISRLIDERDRENLNWKTFEELDLGQQDPKNNTIFSLFEKGDNPFQQFGKGFDTNNRRDYINPYYNDVVLGIRKNASVRTVIHEVGHLIDYYCAKKSGSKKVFLSEDDNFTSAINNIVERFTKKDKNIEQTLISFHKQNDAFHKETRNYDYSKFNPSAKETFEKYDKLSNEEMELNLKNFTGTITTEEFRKLKQLQPITKQLWNEIDGIRKKYGFEAGEDMASAMDDIVSALTGGLANKSNNRLKIQLKGHHKISYWGVSDSKGAEIFTHYLTMKSHPDKKYLDNFKKHFPELDVELERLYDQAYQIMGGK